MGHSKGVSWGSDKDPSEEAQASYSMGKLVSYLLIDSAESLFNWYSGVYQLVTAFRFLHIA